MSYPLLLGADGKSRVQASDPRWLASRSFIAQDANGRIILATTSDAYFSLGALADYTRSTPNHVATTADETPDRPRSPPDSGRRGR